MTNLIENYKTYRKIGQSLKNKIMESYLDHEALMKSATQLGMVQGKAIIFDRDDETSVLMDFALHEYRMNNKTYIDVYREKIGWHNKIEEDILTAFRSAYTSLFKIESISKSENMLFLNDLLNKKDNIKLIDIGLSITGIPGLILFFRLVPLKNFNMTSGASFIFPCEWEKYLLNRYKNNE